MSNFTTNPSQAERVIAIDVDNLAYRAIHVTKDEDPVSVFASCLMNWLTPISAPNTFLVFCLDGDRAVEERRKILPGYKGNRTHSVDDPVPAILPFLRALPGQILRAEVGEADDCVAAVVAPNTYPGTKKYVLSSDSDSWTLDATVYSPHLRSIVTNDHAMTKYGVPKKKVGLHKAFCGETGDGIKGVYKLKKKEINRVINLTGIDSPERVWWVVGQYPDESPYLTQTLQDAETRMTVEKNWAVIQPRTLLASDFETMTPGPLPTLRADIARRVNQTFFA